MKVQDQQWFGLDNPHYCPHMAEKLGSVEAALLIVLALGIQWDWEFPANWGQCDDPQGLEDGYEFYWWPYSLEDFAHYIQKSEGVTKKIIRGLIKKGLLRRKRNAYGTKYQTDRKVYLALQYPKDKS